MTTFPIGLPTRSISRVSRATALRAALTKAAALGADGVEIDARSEIRAADFSQTALRQFRKTLDDAGLRVAALSFPTRRSLADPEDLERRLLALREAMALAYKVGARVVVHPLESIPADESPEMAVLTDSLTILAAQAEHVGAKLALASSAAPERQAELLSMTPDGAIGVALDTGALAATGESTGDAAARLGPRVVYVVARDAVRELSGGLSSATEVELGRGAAEIPEALGALAEHDYRGWVTADRREGPDPVGDLANAVAYLRAM